MFATVNGVDIHYTVAGSGIPCLVPSIAGTPIYERTFASPTLLQQLRLIFVELRANRTAVGDVEALTLGTLVDDLDGLRRALDLDRVAVLGHSAHSILALAYAARYPAQTSHVLAIAGVPGWSPAIQEQRAMYWDVVASPERKRLAAANQARLTDDVVQRLTPSERFIVPYVASGPRYFYDATYDCAPLWAGHDNLSHDLLVRFYEPGGQYATFDPEATFPDVAAPVFIAQGAFDFSAPPLMWAGVKERLRDHTYHAFERSGHYPNMEEQAAFDVAVGAWLRRG
jgi:proline iminopeptidase